MAEKKLKKLSKSSTRSKKTTAQTIKESAGQIWLAGLGAFAKAQEEGGKIFDTLVRDGKDLEKKTRKVTSSTVNEVRGAMEGTVNDVQAKASASWDKLEKIFEDRVAKALSALGVPSSDEIQTLSKRVAELQKSVEQMNSADSAKKPAAKKPAAKKPAAKKTAAKKAPVKKASTKASATAKKASTKSTTTKTTSKKAATKK